MLQATIFASCDDNSELMHFPQNYVGRRLDVLYMSAKKGWIIFHYIEMFFERYTALLFDYGFQNFTNMCVHGSAKMTFIQFILNRKEENSRVHCYCLNELET